MIYFLVILLIFGIVFISIVESILMLSANDFVKVNELAINKKSYIHIIKINIKKLILSITNNQNKRISNISYIANNLLYILMIGSIGLIIIDTFEIKMIENDILITFLRKYLFLVLVIFTFLSRVIGHISNYSKIDINKYFLKSLASIGVIIINYSFVLYFVENDQKFGYMNIILKIILFLNLVISVNVFDSYSKFKLSNASYSQNLFDSISVYFILLSGFIILNSGELMIKSPIKFLYYSLSILLIEFISSYIKKIIGYTKLNQNIKFLFEYLLAYFVVVFLFLLGVAYVI